MAKLRYKIANILTPVEFGGLERINLLFLKNINREIFDVYPILLIRPWEKDNIFIQDLKKLNYKFYKIPVALRSKTDGADYIRIFRAFRLMFSVLYKNNFDLIHTHGYFADLISIPIARLLKLPVISTCHGFIFTDKKLKIYNFLDLNILRICNKIITVSEEIKRKLLRMGICKSRIIVIQNCVSSKMSTNHIQFLRQVKRKTLGFNQRDIIVGYVGRLSIEKGLEYLLMASSKLIELGFPIKIVLIGDGPQKDKLKALVREFKIEKYTFFLGFQKYVEIWLPIFDFFVLPSKTEGTPLVLLEAMAVGLPVIATKVGEIPKILSNFHNGILVDFGNVKKLCDSILYLINNQCKAKIMAKKGKQVVEQKYNVERWIKQIESIYLNELSKKF